MFLFGTIRQTLKYFAASVIEMIITREEETKQGTYEMVARTIWLDYGEFADLREVINTTDFP